MPHRLYPFVADRAGHRCEYCRAPEEVFNHAFEVEHIQPLGRGGTDEPSNLALACRACNGSKHVATTSIDPTRLLAVRLFNPRVDAWSEHFDMHSETSVLRGLTDIGRATIERLHLNGPRHLRARYLWAGLFGFPADPPTQ
ncbi:MAG: HNH endonuclease [Chloroflexota bacterium]